MTDNNNNPGNSEEPKGDPTRAYESGREGSLIGGVFDTDSEAEARERGEQDAINAQATREENEQAKKD